MIFLCTVVHLEADLLKFHTKSGNNLFKKWLHRVCSVHDTADVKVSFLAHLIVAGDDLLQRCKAVQKVLLRDPKFNILMDVSPARKENNVGTSVVSLSLL